LISLALWRCTTSPIASETQHTSIRATSRYIQISVIYSPAVILPKETHGI
jgi:hypothetical protein